MNLFRTFFLLLFLFLLSVPISGECREFFVGRVLTLDRENMQFEVNPDMDTSGSGQDTVVEKVVVQPAPENNLAKNGETILFPGCVAVGEKIRLWGEKVPGNPHLFLVTDIRGCRGGGCMDPTGVRLRLLRARESCRIHFSSEPFVDEDLGDFNRGGCGGAGHGGNGGGGRGRGGR